MKQYCCNEVIKHRKYLGMTLQEFGDALGKTKQAVSQWELGQTNPHTTDLLVLLSTGDWRAEFARDCLAQIAPHLLAAWGAR